MNNLKNTVILIFFFMKNTTLNLFRNLFFYVPQTAKNINFFCPTFYKHHVLPLLSKFFVKKNSFNVCTLLIILNANSGGGGDDTPEWYKIFISLMGGIAIAAPIIVAGRYLSDWYYSGPESNNSTAEFLEANSKEFRDHIYENISAVFNSSIYPNLQFIRNKRNDLPEYADLVSTGFRKFIADDKYYVGVEINFKRAIKKIINDSDLYDSMKESCGDNEKAFLVKVFKYAAKGEKEAFIPDVGKFEINDFANFIKHIIHVGDGRFVY